MNGLSRWHLLAWAGAKTDSTANENIPAAGNESGWTLANANEYLLPMNLECMFAFAMNDTITRARITSQALRDIGYPDIQPLQVAATPTAPLPVVHFRGNGARVKMNDTIGVQASNVVSTVKTAFSAVGVRPAFFPVPPGARTTLFASKSVTLVANSWVSATLTYDQTPPVGRYSVIGMRAYGTNAVFARLIFPGAQQFRPGVVCGNTIAEYDANDLCRYGAYGEWGQFYSVNLPQIDVLGDTAGAQTINVEIDVVALDYPMAF